jgi:transaldolase
MTGSARTDNALQQLRDQAQSPWLDYITRDILENGRLQELIETGITGLTSNPTIFQKAIAGSDLYDEEVWRLARAGRSTVEIYDTLTVDDIRSAAMLLRPVYDRTDGRDGFVSIEESPEMAHVVETSIAEARRLFNLLGLPNVMIKIPGTPEGIVAVQDAIAEGINVNVTLLFSVDTYREVAEAYIAGLEQRARDGLPLDRIASVASFFVSRVDTAVDRALDALIAATDDEEQRRHLDTLHGRAAIANARLAYTAYKETFAGPRWDALARKGARTQRCLWASTGVKNPAYRDVLYAEQLIGPCTINTLPPATIEAFLDHGVVARTLDRDVDQAHQDLAAIERAGINMATVTAHLLQDGVTQFDNSLEQVIAAIRRKREQTIAQSG